MFQMIVAVISVALVAIIALAMIFFGGSIFGSGTDRALYAQLMNHGSQIEGAMKLYQSDNGVFPVGTSTQQLNALQANNAGGLNYLSNVPQGDWYINTGVIYRKLVDDTQCKRVNVAAKMPDVDSAPNNGCPPCESATYSSWPGCTSSTVSSSAN